MATDPNMLNDVPVEEPMDPAPPVPQVSYSARVGATCMWWVMVLGMAFIIALIAFWGITHLSTIGTT